MIINTLKFNLKEEKRKCYKIFEKPVSWQNNASLLLIL